MKTNNPYIIYRPDISQYQAFDFKDKEQQILSELAPYTNESSSLKNQKEKSIIVISTSQTDIENVSKELEGHSIALWIHPNSGYDNIKKDHITSSSFPIVVGNSIRAQAVFQYTIQCFLNSFGSLPHHKSWEESRSFDRSLKVNTLVIGHGHIGKLLTSFLALGEYEYDICDPFLGTKPLDEFELGQYQCVILACSLNESSRKLINHKILKKLRADVVLINPARGKLVDEGDLKKFLKENPRAFAYLDVFEQEPADFESFSHLENCYLSSHIAGVYNQIDETIIKYEYNVIKDYLELGKSEFLSKYEQVLLEHRIKNDILV